MAAKRNFLSPPADVEQVQLSPQKIGVANQVKSRLQLITLITMDIFEQNPGLKTQAIMAIHQNRNAGKDEALYFKDITENKNLPGQFAGAFLQAFAARLESGNFAFAQRVQEELALVREKGRQAPRRDQIVQHSFDQWDFNYVLMGHIGAYMHFPYSELHNPGSSPQLYYAYDPLMPTATTTEVFWMNTGQPYYQYAGGEQWAIQNPTLVFLLDDEIAGNHLDHYLNSICAQGNFMNELCAYELLPPDTGMITQLNPPPPPPNATYFGPIENNIPSWAHATITNDKYLLSGSVPRIRITENVRPGGFWNGPNRLYFYRGRAKIFAPDNPSFSQAVRTDSTNISVSLGDVAISISRNEGRNGLWVDFNGTLTEYWAQEQKE